MTMNPERKLEEAMRLLREAFNAMDEVRCTLNDRGDPTGISSVLAMTLADSQRDVKAFLEGAVNELPMAPPEVQR